MSKVPDEALSFASKQRDFILDELIEFVRIPSVSTDPKAQPDMQRAAEWVASQMHRIGLEHVKIYPTAGHPVVYGDWLSAGPGKPTVLFYGHYDVQPPEPLELWEIPAFEPTMRGENLYGRGASDMKGQVIFSLAAIEALLQTGSLQVNVKFLIEGEEEIGSPSLAGFISEQVDLLKCDYAINPDSGMFRADLPVVTYGLRGLAYFELRLSGPDHDLHSGGFGGAVHNPAQVLCELIAGMHDAQGRITLPGFYDRVKPLTSEEHAENSRLPIDDAFYLGASGAPGPAGPGWGAAG
jgi:acetylornithine deacetylase/succinyl-diaminopimelate desuccinylase-like protein